MITWRLKACLLLPVVAGFALCQPAPVPTAIGPAAGIAKNPAVYIVLKPSLNQPGTARETFLLRMITLGVSDMKFVDSGGTVAVRCTAPAAAIATIATDTDVAGVLPIDDGKQQASAATIPASAAPVAESPIPASPTPALPTGVAPSPAISTPPFVPPSPNLSPTVGLGVGGGGALNLGIAMLTDMAGGALVKLLTPTPGCKVSFTTLPTVVPSLGGTGAFEVKAAGNCAWQAVSTADWLHISSGVLGPGTATVSFSVVAHTAGKRQAAVLLQVVGATGPLHGKTVLMVTQE